MKSRQSRRAIRCGERRLVFGLACLSFLVGLPGCGGGGGGRASPPAPQPSFTLNLSPSTLSLSSGEEARATVSVTAQSGFAGSVNLSVEGLPSSIVASFTRNPISPSETSELVLRVASDAAAQTVSATVRGSSGTLQDSRLLTLQISFVSAPGPVRTTFVRTDMDPLHALYDPIRKQVFVSIPQLNEVKVFSGADARLLARLALPRPLGLELAPDGSRVIVGTGTNILGITGVEFVHVIDPDRLEVVNRVAFPRGLGFSPVSVPEFPIATSNGSIFFIAREIRRTGTRLVQWNPATGSFVDRTPGSLGLGFPQLLVRSNDYRTVLVAETHSAGGTLVVYDADSDNFIHAAQISGSGFGAIRVNPDGTQFAVLMGQEVVFLNRQLQEVTRRRVMGDLGGSVSEGMLYSLDGRFLYVSEQATDNRHLLVVLDTQTFAVVGQVAAVRTDGVPTATKPLAIDETGMIFGANDRGIAFVDVSRPRSLPSAAPIVRLPNALDPPQGSLTVPTATTVNGAGFKPGANVFFGKNSGTDIFVDSSNVIRTKAPPATTPGPVNVTAVFPDGWFAIAPDGFTYGPHILHVIPSSARPEGNTEVEIMGYGFAFSPSMVEVTVGGRSATVVEIMAAPGFTPFPFPLHRSLRIRIPPGSPGAAELTVKTPAGIATAQRAFRYLRRVQTFPVAGGLGQVVYDARRSRLYLSNFSANRVEVFSLAEEKFQAPLPAGTVPQGLALTPDGSRLVVANFGDRTLTIVNPDNPAAMSTILVVGPSDISSSCDPRPVRVSATSTRKVFVQISCRNETRGQLREVDLSTLAVRVRTEIDGTRDMILAATPDGTKLFVAVGEVSGGPVHIWEAATDRFGTRSLGQRLRDAAAAADGNRFAAEFDQLDGALRLEMGPTDFDLLTRVVRVIGQKLQASGSLFYVPLQKGIDVWDVHQGRLRERIAIPEELAVTLDVMALDETGKRVFVITATGLTIVELASVPLSIGSLTPEEGTSAGGIEVVIRGSGFQPGTVVRFGKVELISRFVDENTLRVTTPSLPVGPVRVSIRNPDGEEYILDAAFRYTN